MKRDCSKWCVFVVLLSTAAMVISVLSAVLLILTQELVLSPSDGGDQLTSGSLSLFNPFPVPISPSGYDSLSVRSVNVSLDTSAPDTRARVQFYKTSTLLTTRTVLPSISILLAPSMYVRDPLNYYQADIPLYVAGGDSTVAYVVTASSPLTYDDCPLEIYLFDEQTEYDQFLNGLHREASLGNYLKRSGCLNVQKKNESLVQQTVVFRLSNQSAYFVAVAIEKGVEINCTVSANVVEYSVSSLAAENCSLSTDHLSCVLNISDGSIGAIPGTITYVLAQSAGLSTITYNVVLVLWNVWTVTFVSGFALAVLLLLIVLTVLLVMFCERLLSSHTQRKYTKLSIQSTDCD